jgi:lipid-A-disaccharide synthase
VTTGAAFFEGKIGGCGVKVIEGGSWDAMAHCDLALAASGTVTVEAALLNAPMVTFYKVTPLTYRLGKMLVDVPYYSMVNLIAGRKLVPELIQDDMTAENLASEALRLLSDSSARDAQREGLTEVARRLSGRQEAPQRAARAIQDILEGQVTHAS